MTTINTPLVAQNRDVQAVRQFIENAGAYCILNIYSIKGLGTTTLLQSIWEEYRVTVPTAFVQVSEFITRETESGFRLDRFLQKIAAHLQMQISSAGTEYEGGTAEELAEKIISIISEFTSKGIVSILIIDDYDQLPYGSRSILEDLLLSKVVNTPRHAIVILGSEQELSFTDRLDLRTRLRTYKLSPLSEDDVRRSVPEKYTALAREILKWTGGIPSLVEYFVDRAGQLNINSANEYQLLEKDLLDRSYRGQVRNAIFPDVRMASDEVIDILALLRRFDISILSTTLPAVEPETFASYKQKHYLDLIRELGNRIYWREEGGYALDDTLRSMLSAYSRAFEPERYEKVNNIVAKAYKDWIYGSSNFREYYLTEWLYHHMLYARIRNSSESDIVEWINRSLLEFLRSEAKTKLSPDQLDALEHALRQDKDLSRYISRDVYDEISKILPATSSNL